MTQVIQFAVLGLGVGSLYALAAQGLVQIYRGSGIVNFAQGAFALFGAFTYWELEKRSVPTYVAVAVSLVGTAAVGALVYILVLRPLRSAAPLVRLVATLAVLITIQGIATFLYNSQIFFVNSLLPTNNVSVGGINVTADRLILLGLACATTAALWAFYRFSAFGLATTACAENLRSAAAIGLSPDVIATVNWAFGAFLAAAVGILIIPITALSVSVLVAVMMASLAAALVGGFVSFPLTLLGGLAIGVAETEFSRWTTVTGLPGAVPLMAIALILVVRGRGLPLRDYFVQRQPVVGSGRIRAVLVAIGAATFVVLNATLSPSWNDTFTTTFSIAIVILSIVVVTGYAGQLSLGQWAIAGMGAFFAAQLVYRLGAPFELALLGGMCGAAIVGALFAIPAVRTRGVNLAIVTLGLGTTIQLVVFNGRWGGGFDGVHVGRPQLFGMSIDAPVHPARYALVVFVTFLVVAVAVANLRRGRVGRRMLAVRANERAAAALGVNVVEIKLYAMTLAAAIAAVGGIFAAFRTDSVVFGNIFNTFSITLVGYAMIGGIGWIGGSVIGGSLAIGGVGMQLAALAWPGITTYATTLGGGLLVLMVLANPDGLAREMARTEAHGAGGRINDILHPLRTVGRQAVLYRRLLLRYFPMLRRFLAPRERTPFATLGTESTAAKVRVEPKSLVVDGISVRYGAVTAVDRVSFQLRPGEVLGLIGPNGAGKTSLIDALSGFSKVASGKVSLGGDDVSGWSAARRARAGLTRSFQTLELFDDATVLENLRAAVDPRDRRSYLFDLVFPRNPPLTQEAVAVIREFSLEADLLRNPDDLSFSQRRLVATARAVASGPSVVMLDEPAAGMSDVRRREVAKMIRRLADEWGIAILVIEHDVQFVAAVCDRVMVLNFGQKIADGTPEDVRSDPVVIDAYLRTSTDDGDPGNTQHGAGYDRIRVRTGGTRKEVVLAARDLSVGYDVTPVVSGLDFEARAGEIVALLGANQSGKTTTLLSLAGELRPLAGDVYWLGKRLERQMPLHRRAAQGLGYLTEHRSVFSQLSVEQNLRLGNPDIALALRLFPELEALWKRKAGLLSGGEQQMLGLARALARNPKALLIDEMTLGLAPQVVSRLMTAVRTAADEQGVAVVLVEQHVRQALGIADSVCVIAGRRMTLAGPVDAVGDKVEKAFLADLFGTNEAATSVAVTRL